MKRHTNIIMLAFILVMGASICAKAQSSLSYWYGELSVNGMILPITLQIDRQDTLKPIQLGSPAQTKEMFAASKYRFTITDSILFSVRNMGVVYRGKFNQTKDSITGSFKQGMLLATLTFARTAELYQIKRLQDEEPLPKGSVEKELSFIDKSGYKFSGTLTLPSEQGKYPCVILVTGSGTQNRDEEVMGHKPFKVIATEFAKKGIATFRYDDRGWGVSVPDSALLAATTMTFANDCDFILSQIKNQQGINPKQIGILGHSEGGAIASICASRNKDVAFVVLMAAPGERGIDVLLQQNKKIYQAEQAPQYVIDCQLAALNKMYELTHKHKKEQQIEKVMNEWFDTELAKYTPEQQKEIQFSSVAARQMFVAQMSSEWMKCFLSLDPSKYLRKVKQPLLAMNGKKDFQVLEEYNIPVIQKAMAKAKNKRFEVYTPEDMNHLFQECKTGTVNEYQSIEQTISPKALQKMTDFILNCTK